jgi:oxepin-CoA hydrolase/3-oxo-5,6-dehydrosuberyl-CoA semialdehyde dehydrogenase
VPSLVKPASPTAFLTAKLSELIIDSGLLPEGTWQFVAGSLGDTFDHLTGQDLVAFTGSAATAATLRAHPVIVRNGVRFSAEADSLNFSALGPDAAPGTPEFDLFVGQLVTEMTVKAGQKCTAIRRAFVPAEHVDAVVEAVSAKLAETPIGALASLEQREEVRRSVKALTDAGRVAYEGTAPDGPGAHQAPILLVGDPERAEPHEVEAFGPVSTVLPYTSTAQLIDYAARGLGSLAGSVVTGDRAFAREVVLGVAPFHGRVLVLTQADAAESTGHGSPMPQLVHGGPGRAGGGEELGGIRGVLHHMQRTAVQGDPDTLTAITGRWVAGSARTTTDEHPFRKDLSRLSIGDTIVGGPRTVTQEDVEHFAEFTGDTFYAHMDAEAAAANPLFGERVAHGYLIVSFAAGLFVDPAPGPVLANFGVDNLRFLTPVKFGDALTVTLTCKQITPRDTADYGEVRWDADVTRQDGESVARYDVLTLVAK